MVWPNIICIKHTPESCESLCRFSDAYQMIHTAQIYLDENLKLLHSLQQWVGRRNWVGVLKSDIILLNEVDSDSTAPITFFRITIGGTFFVTVGLINPALSNLSRVALGDFCWGSDRRDTCLNFKIKEDFIQL
jgi:hypothetical protein